MPTASHNKQRSRVATTRQKPVTGVTPRQLDLLLFINTYTRQSGLVPTNREMRVAMSLASPATVHVHLVRLEKNGLIARDPETRRNVSITPKGMELCGKYASRPAGEVSNG